MALASKRALPHKKLKNDGLPIVENHRKAIITNYKSGVIRTPPRSCVLQHSPKSS